MAMRIVLRLLFFAALLFVPLAAYSQVIDAPIAKTGVLAENDAAAFFKPVALRVPRHRTADKKFWLLSGTLAATSALDIASTIRCQHWTWPCTEGNPLLGRHPGDARIVATLAAGDAARITISYFMKRSHNRFLRRTWWVLPAYGSAQHVRWAANNFAIHHYPYTP